MSTADPARRFAEHLDVAPHALRDYALIADGERGALIGPRGDVAWMCFPRWHDDAVFTALVGGRCTYTVSPRGRFVWGGHYEPGSLIWRSRWITETGIVECREALALPAEQGRAVLLRRVEAVRGAAVVDVFLRAGAGFDRHGMARLHLREDGDWSARLGDERMRFLGAGAAQVLDDEGALLLWLDLRLEQGERHDLVLALSGDAAEMQPAGYLWEATAAAWEQRVPRFSEANGELDVRRSYAVLSGLTSTGGGMVAAATTSLPERAEAGRNYDYRYVWIRDQAYAGQAVAAAGPHPLMDHAVSFVSQRLLADGAGLMPAYTVEGRALPAERSIELPGYPGGHDIAGNWVRGQFQLDAFGEALLLFAAAADHDHLDAESWRAAEIAASAIEQRRNEPDAGIWELEPARWTHSRLICAAGLRAIAAAAPGRELGARWLALADDLLARTSAECLHPAGRWQRTPDDPRLDASLLTPALRGALPSDDPRSLATLQAVRDELTEDGYCYRFRADDRPLGEAEGAFLLCGFWLALALAQAGEGEEARAWFERNRAASGSPGLLSEEFDVRQRQLRGNLPQAFVHALLIECGVRL